MVRMRCISSIMSHSITTHAISIYIYIHCSRSPFRHSHQSCWTVGAGNDGGQVRFRGIVNVRSNPKSLTVGWDYWVPPSDGLLFQYATNDRKKKRRYQGKQNRCEKENEGANSARMSE